MGKAQVFSDSVLCLRGQSISTAITNVEDKWLDFRKEGGSNTSKRHQLKFPRLRIQRQSWCHLRTAASGDQGARLVDSRRPRPGMRSGDVSPPHHLHDGVLPAVCQITERFDTVATLSPLEGDQSDVHVEQADIARTTTSPQRPSAAEVAEQELLSCACNSGHNARTAQSVELEPKRTDDRMIQVRLQFAPVSTCAS